MNTTIDGVRAADLQTMLQQLTDQQASKVDLVIPAAKVRTRDAKVTIAGQEPHMDASGVTDINGTYRLAEGAVAQLAERVGMPVRYLRKLVAERTDIADANINGWLRGKSFRRGDELEVIHPADERNFLLRLFRPHDETSDGLVRALLSDQFGIVDHLDVMAATMSGIQQAGAEVKFHSCNLNDSRMSVQVYSPQVAALAPKFLEGYRNPFVNPKLEAERQAVQKWREVAAREGMDYAAGEEPVIYAGFEFGNSETGNGKTYLRPKMLVRACKNGLTLPLFEISRIHLGARLEVGAVRWSADTQRKALELITSQAKDAVAEWLSPEFLTERVNELEVLAGAELLEPAKAIEVVAKEMLFSEAERDGIFAHFLQGRQMTAAGVVNAITSYSQTVGDFERADELDAMAVSAGFLLTK